MRTFITVAVLLAARGAQAARATAAEILAARKFQDARGKALSKEQEERAKEAELDAQLEVTDNSLFACRESVTRKQKELAVCRGPTLTVTCNCFCPTCLPEVWPHRRKPGKICTTPPPTEAPTTIAAAAPMTPPPPPPLEPLEVLRPINAAYLPTVGPLPPTVEPTTTTTTPVPPAPAPAPVPMAPGEAREAAHAAAKLSCMEGGNYNDQPDHKGKFNFIGKGICKGAGTTKTESRLVFRERRGLNIDNVECMCKEICNHIEDCVGLSIKTFPKHGDGRTAWCRLYGPKLQSLMPLADDSDWKDYGSMGNEKYEAHFVTVADGTPNNKCYAKELSDDEQALLLATPGPAPAAAASLLQDDALADRLDMDSMADRLVWQRQQLKRCKAAEEQHVALLDKEGCGRSLRKRGPGLIPSECSCDCPICNWWQLPPPACQMPPPFVEPVEEKVNDMSMFPDTPPPPKPTPPMTPPEIPVPPLPPIGEQYLPTLAPLDAPKALPSLGLWQRFSFLTQT